MGYASENYGNDSENETGDGLDILRNKYGSDRTQAQRTAAQQDPEQQSVNDTTGGKGSDYLQSTNNQARAGALANEQARDAQFMRDKRSGENALELAGQRDDQNAKSEYNSRKLIQNIDQGKVDIDNKFKASESALDRGKSSDEFSQNRYQAKQNQAQDRANLEYSTAQGLAKDKQGQDAELVRLRASGDVASALADKTNNANLNLANITATTERSGQTSAVDRARLAANAQIKAALFAPRQYSGY